MLRARDLGIILSLGTIAAVAVQACGSKSGGTFGAIDGGADTGTADVTTAPETGADSSSSGAGEAGCIICGDAGGSSSGGQSSPIPTTCADSVSRNSYIGCDYWPTVTLNPVWPQFDYAVAVSNPQTSDVTVTVTGGALTASAQGHRAGGEGPGDHAPVGGRAQGADVRPEHGGERSGAEPHRRGRCLPPDDEPARERLPVQRARVRDRRRHDRPRRRHLPGRGRRRRRTPLLLVFERRLAAPSDQRRQRRLRRARVAVLRRDAGLPHGGGDGRRTRT